MAADALPDPPYDLRLIPLAAAAWGTAWWGVTSSSRTVVVLASTGTGALVLMLVLARRRHAAGSLVLIVGGLAAVSAVSAVTAGHLAARERDPVVALAGRHATVDFTGRVTTDPQRLVAPPGRAVRPPGLPQRWTLRVTVTQVQDGDEPSASRASVVVLAGPDWSSVVVGSHVRAVGRLEPAEPGDSALAVAAVRRGPVVLDRGAWPWQIAERLRAGLRRACVGLPDDAAGLLPGLVVGDTSRLDDGLRADLKASGLTHLTAVSGSNVTILAASLVGCARPRRRRETRPIRRNTHRGSRFRGAGPAGAECAQSRGDGQPDRLGCADEPPRGGGSGAVGQRRRAAPG